MVSTCVYNNPCGVCVDPVKSLSGECAVEMYSPYSIRWNQFYFVNMQKLVGLYKFIQY